MQIKVFQEVFEVPNVCSMLDFLFILSVGLVLALPILNSSCGHIFQHLISHTIVRITDSGGTPSVPFCVRAHASVSVHS